MKEFPSFQQSYNDHNGAFEILSIGSKSSDPNAPAYVSENGFNWEFGYSDEALKAYNVSSIPFTLFINSQGEIVDEKVGGMDHTEFEKHLSKIL